MTYTPDANELAARDARRRLERDCELEPGALDPVSNAMLPGTPPRGTLTIWVDGQAMMLHGMDPTFESSDVTIDLRVSPNTIVAYSPDGSAEIFSLLPGSYACFVPDREG